MNNGNWINVGMLIVAIISALTAIGSLWFTYYQWQKLKRKIGMLSDAGKAIEILPAWYASRMMQDYWLFGLLTSDGRTLILTNILSLSDDGKWMDVELAVEDDYKIDKKPNYVFAIAHDRKKASIQVSQIVAAIELITS